MRLLSATLAAAAICAGPSLAQSVEIETATGPAEVPSNPETTVVYDIAALDTLDALGIEGLRSISTTYLDHLSDYAGDAGTIFEPDFEALNAMQPDLIVVGGRSMEQLGAVSDFAPAIDMTLPAEDLLENAKNRIAAYGTIWGKEAEAEDLAAQIDDAVAQAQAAAEGKGDALIVLTNGPKVSAYGPGTRFGWLHDATNLPAAATGIDASDHGEAISFEFIRDADPDWLLVIDRGAAIGAESQSAEATLDNPLVRETTAWQKDQVIYLDPAALYIASGGAQATLDVLGSITDALGQPGS